MASTTGLTPVDYLTPKPSAAQLRPSESGEAGSPRTPLSSRSFSGLYSSPGGSFRNDEENNVVIEVGSRFMRVGIAGEPYPRRILSFGPDEQRRVGDYRQWMPDHERSKRKRKRGQSWGQEHELWRDDIRDVDLGLVEDKLERVMRKVDSEVLMLDDRKKRLTVVVASDLARPLLSILLSTLFTQFQTPSITVFSASTASLVASGLRSGVIVDIGWSNTTVTVVVEYRQLMQRRSIRAGKLLSESLNTLLNEEYARQSGHPEKLSFDETEEILSRLAWCRPSMQYVSATDDRDGPSLVSIPFPTSDPPFTLSIPFQRLSEPAESALLGSDSQLHPSNPQSFDNDDLPLPLLLFQSLLELPIDVRRECMSRIIIIGGASKLPGLKSRIVEDLKALVRRRGWDPIHNYGKTRKHQHGHPAPVLQAENNVPPPPGEARPSRHRAASRPQEPDPILASLERQAKKDTPQATECDLRAVETLGAWAGGSLAADLKLRSVVEVERESFMQHGLAGASKEKDVVSKAARRQSFGPGARASDRASWTLGMWA